MAATKKRRRSAPRARRKKKPKSSRRWLWWGVAALVLPLAGVSALYAWGSQELDLEGPTALQLEQTTSAADAVSKISTARLLAVYAAVFFPWASVDAGPHLVPPRPSAASLLRVLTRSSRRPVVRVTLPEGLNVFQVAKRLQTANVCPEKFFVKSAFDQRLLTQFGVSAPSAEGYLFPATYELRVNTPAQQALSKLIAEAQRRHSELLLTHQRGLALHKREFGWTFHDVLTLASIVERETGDPEERGLVASVFFNRLRDPEFRPVRMLQSDPTAAYGCQVAPADAPSCQGFSGRVTPAMLRDAANRYNTYRYAGLPPGPICNPSLGALEAVLNPPATRYFFFMADGRGGHTFSETLQQHQSAIDSRK